MTDPMTQLADMIRRGADGLVGALESFADELRAETAVDDPAPADPAPAEPAQRPEPPLHDCSGLALDAELAPGRTIPETRIQCGGCGTWWVPVFDRHVHMGWQATPVRSPREARFLPVPTADQVQAERARRRVNREPASPNRGPADWPWRTGHPFNRVEKESLLFEQTDIGDRFIGEMINGEFAAWVVEARTLAKREFEAAYLAADRSADAFREFLRQEWDVPDDVVLDDEGLRAYAASKLVDLRVRVVNAEAELTEAPAQGRLRP